MRTRITSEYFYTLYSVHVLGPFIILIIYEIITGCRWHIFGITTKRVATVLACVAKKYDDWVKKCMEYEVEGTRPRGRPKRT